MRVLSFYFYIFNVAENFKLSSDDQCAKFDKPYDFLEQQCGKKGGHYDVFYIYQLFIEHVPVFGVPYTAK